MQDNNFKNWSKAHNFYSLYLQERKCSKHSFINDKEFWWRKHLVKNAPNGQLLIDNSIFDSMQKKTINLLHVTTKFDEIIKSGCLYSSGGCLIGSVYCTPLIDIGKQRFRLHNLGRYIYEKETPNVLSRSNQKNKAITPLILKITVPKNTVSNLIGPNYLKMGDIHLSIYKKFSYLLSEGENNELKERIIQRIRKNLGFLCRSNRSFYYNENYDSFLEELCFAIESLPILGYLYFESVSEFLMLYNQSNYGKESKRRKEFDNYSYKELMYKLYPDLLKNFSLGEFRPSKRELRECIESMPELIQINENELFNHVKNRVIFWINSYLFSENIEIIDWHNLEWNFSFLKKYISPLLGHLIHREMRNFGRYPDFYFYFDQQKALEIWNYWNNNHIIVPFNGVIPKGEIGINPAYSAAKFDIFLGDIHNNNGGLYIEKKKKMDLEVVPRLIDPRHTFMRNKSYF